MKHLIIVRHAKSSWDDLTLADIDRPLNDRGERDAPAMARRLKERDLHPQQMITSPAIRALTTCLRFAEVLSFPVDQIIKNKKIYHASEETLLEVVRGIPERKSSGPVMLFGHNPGLTSFANSLLDEDIHNIPTAGVVSCLLDIDRWEHAKPGCGELEFFDYPKRVRK